MIKMRVEKVELGQEKGYEMVDDDGREGVVERV